MREKGTLTKVSEFEILIHPPVNLLKSYLPNMNKNVHQFFI